MFPLSTSQQIVWLHEQLQPGSRAYNFTAALDMWGTLDEDALRRGLTATLERHPGLRLELAPTADGVPAQRVVDSCAPRLRTVDLSGRDDPEAAFAELLRTEAETPLDTSRAPLLRWTLARLAPDQHRLIHVEHHLVHDGHSFAIVLSDIFSAYRAHVLGEAIGPRPVTPSYEEHVHAAAAPDAAAARTRSLAYWQDELRTAAFDLPLPGLTRPGARRRHHGGQLRQSIGADLALRLRAHARDRGLTPFSALLGLFAELLRRHSGRPEVVIGTAVGNRPRGFEETVGMFVNTIPLRLRLDPNASADDVMDEVTDTLIRALPHQDVPVQELTRALGLHTSGSDNPLFSVMFSAHDAVLPEIDVPGLDVTLFEGFNTGTTRFDLDLVLLPDDRRGVSPRQGAPGMTLVWDYDADLFGEDTAELLATRLLDLLRSYLADPSAPLSALGPAPAAPAPEPPLPEAAGSATLLDPAARHDPSLPALLIGARQLTYGDLDERVTSLAERLRACGITAGQPLATVLPRGADCVVALLACLRTGAVYCPLSPRDPADRLATLLDRLDPALVLTTTDGAARLDTDRRPVALVDSPDFPRAHAARTVEGAAYIIHTSGSTGIPKPVAVGRPALENHLTGAAARFALRTDDRVLLFAQPSFDVALEEVLPSLHAGACLVVPDREVPTGAELADLLAAARVTVANLPTSYFLATREDLRPALRDGRWAPRLVVLGGERIPADALRAFLDDTSATVLNVYGVTEASISSTVHEITGDDLADGAEIPLGTELPGERAHVLDEGLRPLPAGAVGELAIGGAGLAQGYVGNAETTAARFVRVEALGGERVYLTGDLGYRDLDGRLCFLGRRDNQVKLRGYRIELEEIEAAASAFLGGRSCAVVLDREAPGGPLLIGFLEGTAEPDQEALHAGLSRRLPAAMVPGRWVALDTMPTLAGGKPDRGSLGRTAAALAPLRPRPDAQAPADFSAPEVALLAEGWRAVLGHMSFTETSHFFRIGGHSLLAAHLAAWLEPRLGSRPPLRVLFENPVLADQARALTAAGTTPALSEISESR
ncbi:amino acid adenylation domain-containing protein [Streptomyces sp. H10-C2]|uniref:non-ribosomal peptide synthetase n=1 Tax=unclassified Streptomyces TaxID=2593676 RepID=UPI0024BA7278|nr:MULTISPECIES: amino acid adenylation domain-containing protein [unclassified Streptomyces]MDJ0343479.1 amino acid adenylation domain-containing protein [Streptomyces sp. PH10-H1]MDJ0371559.1 amino acid adenylation domain-containing protein [Streptomyces sp. H10-C2]